MKGRKPIMMFRVLDFVKSFIDEKGYPPTCAEISSYFGYKSANAAKCHLHALQRHGKLELAFGISRGIKVIA